MPVAARCMAASTEMYALGLGCAPKEIGARWAQALANPVPPELVARGPVQEVVYTGAALAEAGGLDMLPIPLATPGMDNAPYTSASYWITKDPETGIRNVGTYRGSSRALCGWAATPPVPQKGVAIHWRKARRGACRWRPRSFSARRRTWRIRRCRFPAARRGRAGGGRRACRAPLPLVRCQTVDLEVPAEAEIVIEGALPTDCLEEEGPFGEFTGYMARREYTYYLEGHGDHAPPRRHLQPVPEPVPAERVEQDAAGGDGERAQVAAGARVRAA